MSGMWKRSPLEKYSWFSLDLSAKWGMNLLLTLGIIALSISLFVLYCYFSDDLSPDSLAGYISAIMGVLFMFLAALGYTRSRQSHKRSVGQLSTSLHWHISFGMIALVCLFLHSFGNFNPRTGTYALYSMIALVVSGAIGRVLSRIMPKLIAYEVKHALTMQDEEVFDVQRALHQEEYYRVILNYWRIGHIMLVFTTLGLTLWHLEYVATLLLPIFLQSMPSY